MKLLTKIRWAIGVGILASSVTPALAQSCAMCYQTAKAMPKDGQTALNHAILVMLFPPIAAMTIGVGFAFRYGKQRDQERDQEKGTLPD